MRRRTMQPIVVIAVGLLAIVSSAGLLGHDQPPGVGGETEAVGESESQSAVPKPTPATMEMFRELSELSRLRDEVGESVLGGTLLETAPEESRADSRHMQRLLGLAAGTPEATDAPETETPPRAVRMLRTQCVQLERIANELEESEQYTNADRLRLITRRLRLLARQLHD